MFKKLCLLISLFCFTSCTSIAAVNKKTKILKVPNRFERVIGNVNKSIVNIVNLQNEIDAIINKLEYYTQYQATQTSDGGDWAAAMVITYEFKQMSLRNLASVMAIKQMLFLKKDHFPTYLEINYHLILEYFTSCNMFSIKIIEANYKFIEHNVVVKESQKGVKLVKQIESNLVNIFSNFVDK